MTPPDQMNEPTTPTPPSKESRAHDALNAVIDQCWQREWKMRGIGPNTIIPTLHVSREAWDTIVNEDKARGNWVEDPTCSGKTEYRGHPVVVVNDASRPGIWAEVHPKPEPVGAVAELASAPLREFIHSKDLELRAAGVGCIEELVSRRDLHKEHERQCIENIAKLRAELAEVTQQRDSISHQLSAVSNTRHAANARALKYEAERDALLEMTWLDGPSEPHESIEQWKGQFAAGWVRKTQLDEAEKTIAVQHRLMTSAEQRGAEKGRAESAPAASYRLLETGEIIQEGDEWRDTMGCWIGASGCLLGESKIDGGMAYRRPITGGAGLHEVATCDQRISGIVDENAREPKERDEIDKLKDWATRMTEVVYENLGRHVPLE